MVVFVHFLLCDVCAVIMQHFEFVLRQIQQKEKKNTSSFCNLWNSFCLISFSSFYPHHFFFFQLLVFFFVLLCFCHLFIGCIPCFCNRLLFFLPLSLNVSPWSSFTHCFLFHLLFTHISKVKVLLCFLFLFPALTDRVGIVLAHFLKRWHIFSFYLFWLPVIVFSCKVTYSANLASNFLFYYSLTVSCTLSFARFHTLLVNCEGTTDQIEIILIKALNSGVHQLELPALRQHDIIDSLLLSKNTLGPKDGMFKEEGCISALNIWSHTQPVCLEGILNDVNHRVVIFPFVV